MSILLDPIYNTLGVTATLSASALIDDTDITVIDKTSGVELTDRNGTLTIRPAATVRKSDIDDLGLERADLRGGGLVMRGVTWRIEAAQLKPSRFDEDEYLMILVDMDGAY